MIRLKNQTTHRVLVLEISKVASIKNEYEWRPKESLLRRFEQQRAP
jgi:hypothetical protein